MRLFAGLLGGQTFDSELVGDASLCRGRWSGWRAAAPDGRPHRYQRGQAAAEDPGGRARRYPLRLPVASAQVKSAVLLAGLYAEGQTTVIEPAVTRDHTERMLRLRLPRHAATAKSAGAPPGWMRVRWRCQATFLRRRSSCSPA